MPLATVQCRKVKLVSNETGKHINHAVNAIIEARSGMDVFLGSMPGWKKHPELQLQRSRSGFDPSPRAKVRRGCGQCWQVSVHHASTGPPGGFEWGLIARDSKVTVCKFLVLGFEIVIPVKNAPCSNLLSKLTLIVILH